MKKTISVQIYRRRNIAKQCLDRLADIENISDWTVTGFFDREESLKTFYNLKGHDVLDDVILRDQNLGLKRANKQAIEDQFENGSDINVHVEEDILLGDDALRFTEHCFGNYDLANRTITFCKWCPNCPPGTVHKRRKFSCWGWACTRGFYDMHFSNIEDQEDIVGWATEVSNYFEENGLEEIYGALRKARNIGRKGYHDFVTEEWQRQNNDIYTGNPAIGTCREWTPTCLNNQCQHCKERNEY